PDRPFRRLLLMARRQHLPPTSRHQWLLPELRGPHPQRFPACAVDGRGPTKRGRYPLAGASSRSAHSALGDADDLPESLEPSLVLILVDAPGFAWPSQLIAQLVGDNRCMNTQSSRRGII